MNVEQELKARSDAGGPGRDTPTNGNGDDGFDGTDGQVIVYYCCRPPAP